MEGFRYFGTTQTDENCLREEIKSRLNLGNACYRSDQKNFSSCLPTKNMILIKNRSAVLTDVLYRCETWYLTLRKEHGLRVHEK
jgi:hypothetical protein